LAWDYTIKEIGDKFEIVETEKLITPKKHVYLVDEYGEIVKTTKKRYSGRYSPIWIPCHSINSGNEYDDGYRLVGETTWDGMNVFTIKYPNGVDEKYYEKTTCFLVGEHLTSAGTVNDTTLVQSNIDFTRQKY